MHMLAYQNISCQAMISDFFYIIVINKHRRKFSPIVHLSKSSGTMGTMFEVWRIPELKSITHSGKEWLLNTVDSFPEVECCMLLMTMWRCWHIRNELLHNKYPPPVDVSKRFLCSYLDSLQCISSMNPLLIHAKVNQR